MPGRTDNEIKNHWNTHIKKKLLKMGIDPATHQPLAAKQADAETKNSADTSSRTELLEPAHLRSRQDHECAEDCSKYSAGGDILEDVDDVLLGDEVWKLSSNGVDDAELGLTLDWLLDYQDFMMEDFGFSRSEVDDK